MTAFYERYNNYMYKNGSKVNLTQSRQDQVNTSNLVLKSQQNAAVWTLFVKFVQFSNVLLIFFFQNQVYQLNKVTISAFLKP